MSLRDYAIRVAVAVIVATVVDFWAAVVLLASADVNRRPRLQLGWKRVIVERVVAHHLFHSVKTLRLLLLLLLLLVVETADQYGANTVGGFVDNEVRLAELQGHGQGPLLGRLQAHGRARPQNFTVLEAVILLSV